MLNIAVIGGGSIGLASSAFFANGGHHVRLWRRAGADSLADFGIEATGAVAWKGQVQSSIDLAQVVRGAEAVILCLPANAHRRVMADLAGLLEPGQAVLVSAQYSLSGLYLAQELERRGIVGVMVVALATTMLTARRIDRHRVNVLTVRGQYGFATIPPQAERIGSELMRSLTGKELPGVRMTEIIFGNPNPTAHAPNALCNLTRIEKGEVWSNYGMMTGTVCALIEGLDAERRLIAEAFDAYPTALTTHVHDSFGTPLGTLTDMYARIVEARGGGPSGPTSLESRYITEDIAFGIVPVGWLAGLVGAPAPLHRAFVALFSQAFGRNFEAENDLLPVIAIGGSSRSEIIDDLNGSRQIRAVLACEGVEGGALVVPDSMTLNK